MAALVAAAAAPAALNAQVIMGLPDDSETVAPATKQTPSDAVKSGMSSIRKLVIDTHTLITHRRLAPEQARRFAADVKRYVTGLQADPAAPALAEVLTPISDGAAQIGGPISGTSQLDGLDKIDAALARYPQLFDDPDWKPLR